MTRQEQNALIIEAITRGLQLDTTVEENIGMQFKAWVLGKMQQVKQNYMPPSPPEEQEQEQQEAS